MNRRELLRASLALGASALIPAKRVQERVEKLGLISQFVITRAKEIAWKIAPPEVRQQAFMIAVMEEGDRVMKQGRQFTVTTEVIAIEGEKVLE